MSYKYSKGSTVQGDIKAADDTQRDTLIDFGEDQIDFQTSGSVRLQVSNDGVYIPDTAQDASLFVSGGIQLTPGNQQGIRFANKGSTELNFISFQEGSEGGSYNARMGYNSEEYLFIAPGRGGDFFINTGESSGDFTYPFSIMDDGTVKFQKGLTDVSERAADLASDIAFYVSGTTDGNNNALFEGNVVMSGGLDVQGELFFDDTIMAELSIPGLDLQTDTNAFRFNAPYNMDIQGLDLYLDQHTTAGNVEVTVASGSTNMITLVLTGNNLSANTTTVISGSINANDQVTFAITATPANAQGLRANLSFRRRI